MFRVSKFRVLAAALLGAVAMSGPTGVRADFQIRATEFGVTGLVVGSSTSTSLGGPLANSFQVANFSLPDFVITLVSNISSTGSNKTSHSTNVNVTYVGPTGAAADSLLIEVLGNNYVNPLSALPNVVIKSNASPSTSGLSASNVTMTSGVFNGTVLLASQPLVGSTYGPLTGQLGMTTAVGAMVSSSSVLMPNPVSGAPFSISNPFTFYQTYGFSGITSEGQGSLSAGSTVSTPAPAGLTLALVGLPLLGTYGWLRNRRKVGLSAA